MVVGSGGVEFHKAWDGTEIGTGEGETRGCVEAGAVGVAVTVASDPVGGVGGGLEEGDRMGRAFLIGGEGVLWGVVDGAVGVVVLKVEAEAAAGSGCLSVFSGWAEESMAVAAVGLL